MQARDPATVGNAQQHGREGTAAGSRRRGVVGEVVAEVQSTARFGGLEDRELFDTHFGAELQRVVSADPGQVVSENKTVLFLNRRQVGRASDSSGAIAEGDVRQATVVRTIRDVGKVQLSTDVLVGVKLISVCIDPVVTRVEIH